jgi:hypothetical protein
MDEMTPRPTRTRAILLLAVVLLFGMICGAALFFLGQHSLHFARPPGPQGRPLERLSQELDLDADQRRAIRAILEEQRVNLRGVLEDSHQAIREVLRPDQQQRFDELRPPHPDWRPGWPGHRRHRRGPPPHGPPPPHEPPPPEGAPPPPPEGPP